VSRQSCLSPKETKHDASLSRSKIQETNDDLETYMRRLICALTGRFVCISRTDASEQENLRSSGGIPRSLVRYWWRYWDNEHTVYEITWEKWRGSLHNHQNGGIRKVQYYLDVTSIRKKQLNYTVSYQETLLKGNKRGCACISAVICINLGGHLSPISLHSGKVCLFGSSEVRPASPCGTRV
jgi:hypothetical protein